jgi:hypothetical protein
VIDTDRAQIDAQHASPNKGHSADRIAGRSFETDGRSRQVESASMAHYLAFFTRRSAIGAVRIGTTTVRRGTLGDNGEAVRGSALSSIAKQWPTDVDQVAIKLPFG